MPVHSFNADFTAPSQAHVPGGTIASDIPGVRQLSHAQGGTDRMDGGLMAHPYQVEEFLMPGFRSLDEAMQRYWSGIRVPTKDSYRLMRVKIAGGDKSLLIWADDLQEGRARLPVAAINRGTHTYNNERYSPPHLAMAVRFLNTRGNLAAKVFRPVPFLVDYTITIWAERKRDADHILYQVLSRFNPLAEFRMSDGKLQGCVQLRYGSCTDASDKESGFDQHAEVRYEMSVTAEAWLPLPEVVLPTVLGQMYTAKERTGVILQSAAGQAMLTPTLP